MQRILTVQLFKLLVKDSMRTFFGVLVQKCVTDSSCARKTLRTKQFVKHCTYVYVSYEWKHLQCLTFFYITYVWAVFMAAALIIH